ncbi:hypothetical protein, partial [Granulicella cerasi]|uniref:hypothetical protein n=1 Tax=Granulicella cerasi TaxID=741063 RepID=UPI0021E0BD77
ISLSAGGGAVRFAHASSTCRILHRSELGDHCATLTIQLVQNIGQTTTVCAWAQDPSNFELIASRLRQAVDNPEKVNEWIAQSDYLRSEAGSYYLDVIYRAGGVITPKVEDNGGR